LREFLADIKDCMENADKFPWGDYTEEA